VIAMSRLIDVTAPGRVFVELRTAQA